MYSNVDFSIPNAQDVQEVIKNINYSQDMILNKNDLVFVGLIVGLQVIRQWLNKEKILNRIRMNDQAAAKTVKHNGVTKKIRNDKDRVAWILGPTSYDAIGRSSAYFQKKGIAGTNHRYTTLAHDPLVGLFVGPVNLLSNTITYNTKIQFGTSNVVPKSPGNPATGYAISRPTTFTHAVTKSISAAQSRKGFLQDAIIKHLLHLASDIGTTQGLIIPGLSLLPNINNLQGSTVNAWLIKNEFDSIWFADLFVQAGISELINYIGSFMYKFLLYRDTSKAKEFVDAKCKKVLAVANAIASTEDAVVTLIRVMSGNVIGGLREMDWGGLIVTLKSIMQSKEFQAEIMGIIHVWDGLSFDLHHSAEDMELDFQKNIEETNKKYRVIIKNMTQEYMSYADLELRAADLNTPGNVMFANSIDFSDLNKARKVLRSKDNIDKFFDN